MSINSEHMNTTESHIHYSFIISSGLFCIKLGTDGENTQPAMACLIEL